MTAAIATIDARLAVLQRTLEIAGWSIDNIDINAGDDRARIELRRRDLGSLTDRTKMRALCVVFDGDARSHMIEREYRQWVDGAQRYSGRWDIQFLGRSRLPMGWRSGLYRLCTYLADNGTRQLDAAQVRAALAPLMG